MQRQAAGRKDGSLRASPTLGQVENSRGGRSHPIIIRRSSSVGCGALLCHLEKDDAHSRDRELQGGK